MNEASSSTSSLVHFCIPTSVSCAHWSKVHKCIVLDLSNFFESLLASLLPPFFFNTFLYCRVYYSRISTMNIILTSRDPFMNGSINYSVLNDQWYSGKYRCPFINGFIINKNTSKFPRSQCKCPKIKHVAFTATLGGKAKTHKINGVWMNPRWIYQ